MFSRPRLLASLFFLASLASFTLSPLSAGGRANAAPAVAPGDIVYPADSGVLNVRTQFGAKGDGIADDTTALQHALSEGLYRHRVVYLPRGTYLVSDTLRWNNGAKNNVEGWGGFLQLQGQSRTGTVIRLRDNAPRFGDPAAPRAIVQTGSGGSDGVKRYTGGEGNEAFENHLRDFTVDAGRGNRGAIGIDYQVSNVGAMRHVTIRSGDAAGYCGIRLERRDNGPGLIKDVWVDGFQYGIRTGQEIAQFTLEDVHLSRQTQAGIWVRDSILAIRKLFASGEAPAIDASGSALVDVFDSVLTRPGSGTSGVGSDLPAIRLADGGTHAVLRGVRTPGYRVAVLSRGVATVAKTAATPLADWTSDAPLGDVPAASLPRLPVRETPEIALGDPTGWAEVGPPSGDDDTAAVLSAVRSGRAVVFFRYGTYRISRPISVPPSVRCLTGVGATVEARQAMPPNAALFEFPGGTAADITLVDRLTVAAKKGLFVRHNGPRTLVLRDLLPFDASVYVNEANSGPLFLEDVSSAGYRFAFPTRVWARQWNLEGSGEPKAVNRGAKIWALGFKCESGETVAENRDGGQMELWGGLLYTFGTDLAKPAFVNRDATLDLSFSGTTYVGDRGFFTVLVQNTVGGKTTTLPRPAAYPRGNGAAVPLYHAGRTGN